MRITKTNVLKGLVPTISTGVSSDNPANITNEDFSLNYTSSAKRFITIEFGAVGEISYVAVAGTNISGNGNGASRIRVLDGTEVIQTVFIKRDNCVVISFDSRPFSNLIVGLLNDTEDKEISVAYICAGDYMQVPNGGETSGYKRSWLTRPLRTKATVNSFGAPVANLKKRIPLKGSLNLPNMTTDFTRNEYQDFLDFAYENLFFIQEDESIGYSSYCCHEIIDKTPSAHQSTRALQNVSFSFKVFNGL